MATVSYDVNVRLTSFPQKKQTSATTSVERKKYKTGTTREVERGGFSSVSPKGIVGSIKKKHQVLGAGLALIVGGKVANGMNRVIGGVTNNRYREQRMSDTISGVTNPAKMTYDMFKYSVKRHFEVMRENQRIDYNRELSGNSLPYMSKSGGVTL